MHLLFVGTGAADYETVFTCPCPTCATVRARAGRNLRHYSSLLVNGALLLDCGPTAAWRLAELDAPPAQVEALVFTHSHEDHLDVPAVRSLLVARGAERGPLPVYGNAASLARLAEVGGLEPHRVLAGESVELLGMKLTALRASHIAEVEQSLVWVIEEGAVALLYATDTAWPPDDTWQALLSMKLDGVIAEATFGLLGPECHGDCLTNHLNWPEFLRLREALLGASVISPTAPFLATHLSQHLVPPHEEFSRLAQPPVAVAYDGLQIVL